MFEKPPRYRTYLLTMWEERSQDSGLPTAWRFRLEDPRTGGRRGFADVKSLAAALEQGMARGLACDAEHEDTDWPNSSGGYGSGGR